MNMFEMIKSFPRQFQEQHDNLISYELDLDKYKNINNIVIAGMGGSAISADIVSNLLNSYINHPIMIIRDYSLPKWVDHNSLIILSSYSGNTEETLSVYDAAVKTSKMLISITSGGLLKEKSDKDEVPSISIPLGYQPRAAIGFSIMSLLIIFQKLHLSDSTVSNYAIKSSEELDIFFDNYCQKDQYAFQIADKIKDSIVSIYGTQFSTDIVASRFRAQLAENSKIIASHNVLPELNHNEIEGWNNYQFNNITKNIIWLLDKDDNDRIKKRIRISSELLSKIKVDNITISCDGDNRIIRCFKLILLTDMISYHLADIKLIDPIPVHRIMNLKEKMS